MQIKRAMLIVVDRFREPCWELYIDKESHAEGCRHIVRPMLRLIDR